MAQTKVKLISDGVIVQGNLHSSHGITTAHIGEGSNLYYTDARVGSYLSTNSFATESYVGTQITNLVDSSPSTLNTLNELAAALGDDPNFATTTATSIGLKAPLASPTFTGSAHFTGNVELGNGIDQSMDSSANGQLMIDGSGYQGAIALDDQAMHIYHNSSSRSLILGTNETARLTINGSGNATFSGNVTGVRGFFNSGATNVVATFTSTDGTATLKCADPTGNVEFGASGNNFVVQPAGGVAQLTVNDSITKVSGMLDIIGSRSTYVQNAEDDTATSHIFTTDSLVGDFAQLAGSLVLQARVNDAIYRDIIMAGGLGTVANPVAPILTVKGEGIVQVDGSLTINGSSTFANMITINIDDISTGENRGVRIINTNGVDQQWNITAGITGQENDSFCVRDSTGNVNAFTMAAGTGNAAFHGEVSVVGGDIKFLEPNNHTVYIDFARMATNANPTARIMKYEPAATHTGALAFYTSNASGGAPNLVQSLLLDQSQNATFAGRIGIGMTPSADAKLEILNGNLRVRGSSANSIQLSNTSGNTRAQLGNTGNEGDLALWRSNNVKHVFISSYYDSYINNTTSKFGFGTTTPNTKLDVSGPTGTRNRSTTGGSSVYETSVYFGAAGNATTNVSINTATAFPPMGSGGMILVEVSASGYGNSGSNGLVFSYITGGYGGHYAAVNQPYHPVVITANSMQAGTCTWYNPNATTIGITVTTTNSAGMNGLMRVKVTTTY